MLECDSCDEISEDVVLCIDPFAAELYDEAVEMHLCSDCYSDRVDDI